MLNFKSKIHKIVSGVLVALFVLTFSASVAVAQKTGTGTDPSTIDPTSNDPQIKDPNNTGTTDPVKPSPTDATPLIDTSTQNTDTNYVLLEPLGDLQNFDANQSCPFVDYLNKLIKIFLGIAAVLAMIMIIVGGLEYMTSELPSAKGDGKSKLQNALLGLLLALAAYALLNTLNPKLLDLCPKIPKAVISVIEPNSIFEKEATPGNVARCKPIDDPSNPCNPSNLEKYFGDKAEDMSKICNIESGGNSSAESGTDKGTDGTVFSFGLMQINLLANGKYVGPECEGLFITSSSGQTIPPAKYIHKDSSGKYYYDAMLKPGKEAQYNSCKAKLQDPKTNLEIAKQLFDLGGKMGTKWGNMHAWQGDYGVCGSAFN